MQYRGKQKEHRMNPQESARGWVFFALFVLVFPLVMGWLQRAAGGEIPVAEANVVYYLLCVTLVLLLFWSYLKNSFHRLLDHLAENLAVLLLGFAAALALQLLIGFLPLPVENPNISNYQQEFLLSPVATAVIVVALMPIVEEVLFRGLLFGSLRGYSRPLAWAVCVLAYCLYCVWQFVFAYGQADLRYLLLAVQYLPLSLAACACCERGGSVWSAVLLHMAVNGAALLYLVRN